MGYPMLSPFGWFWVTLGAAIILLLAIGAVVFIVLNKSTHQKSPYFDVAFAGALLIALSQLFGPLVATTYPMIFGLDASDYRLEFEHTYIIPSYNSLPNKLSAGETTTASDQHFDEVKVQVQNNTFYNNITALNTNQFINYDKKIFLEIAVADRPDGITASLSRPVIEINQSSNLTIKFKDEPSPGLYRIKVRGTSGDGRIREDMMVIGIPNPGEDEIYFTPREDVPIVFNFEKAVEGSGYFMAYRYVDLNGSGTVYNQDYNQGSGTIYC